MAEVAIRSGLMPSLAQQNAAVTALPPVFFDYASRKAEKVDLALANNIANQCALLVERAAARV